MGNRRVRCQYTGEYGRSGEFYRVSINGRNQYYKDEETYLQLEKERRIKQEINRLVAIDILNYDGNQFLPPRFLKRINELGKTYPFEVVLSTFKENAETLQYWMSQDQKFQNESGRLNYMMAIINNKINDEYEKWKTKERRSKIDDEVKIDMDLLEVEIKHKKSNDGISDFL